MRISWLFLPAVLTAAMPAALSAQAAGTTPLSFTPAQAEAGAGAYAASCAECHQADLRGDAESPPLTGAFFANGWGGHPVRDLLRFVKQNMPLMQPGSLDDQTYVSLVAYLLSMNGVSAGEAPLAIDATGLIPAAR